MSVLTTSISPRFEFPSSHPYSLSPLSFPAPIPLPFPSSFTAGMLGLKSTESWNAFACEQRSRDRGLSHSLATATLFHLVQVRFPLPSTQVGVSGGGRAPFARSSGTLGVIFFRLFCFTKDAARLGFRARTVGACRGQKSCGVEISPFRPSQRAVSLGL